MRLSRVAPGLYISDACRYFWATAPFIGRSMKNVENCEGGPIDHGADAVDMPVSSSRIRNRSRAFNPHFSR
jgi:hypothetical protein